MHHVAGVDMPRQDAAGKGRATRPWPQVRRSARPGRASEATANGFAYAVPATFTGIVGYGRGERSRASANPLIGDLDPTHLPGPHAREHGRRQVTASVGSLRMTRPGMIVAVVSVVR